MMDTNFVKKIINVSTTESYEQGNLLFQPGDPAGIPADPGIAGGGQGTTRGAHSRQLHGQCVRPGPRPAGGAQAVSFAAAVVISC